MKMQSFFTGAMLGLTLVVGGSLAQGQDVQLTSNYEEADATNIGQSVAAGYASDTEEEPASAGCTGNGCAACGSCGTCQACGSNRGWCPPVADPCPRIVLQGFSAFDSWRGVSEGATQSNFGTNVGFN